MSFEYYALKDTNAPVRAERAGVRGFNRSTFSSEAGLSEAPPELEIETDIDEQQAADARMAPDIIAVARKIPLQLIEPLSVDADAAVDEVTAWGVEAVRALEVDAGTNGEEVTVAVLDTGIDTSHPAFQGVALERRNFTTGGDDDSNGHGTHCAGTIFGRDVNGTRIGVATGVRRALIGKVIGPGGDSDQLAKAMKWAEEGGAQVISMSLGYDFVKLLDFFKQRMPEQKALSQTFDAIQENVRVIDRLLSLITTPRQGHEGIVVIAASGNESEANRNSDPYRVSASSPSSADGIIPVGALQERGNGLLGVAPFSNTNVQISAPGVNVISARAGGGLTSKSGTSMACPHVAGVAALHWSDIIKRNLLRSADMVIARLLAGADPDPIDKNRVTTNDYGAGIAQSPV